MRLSTIIFLILIFVFSVNCSENNVPKNAEKTGTEKTTQKKKNKTKKARAKKKKIPRITNKNLESILLEYKEENDADYALIKTSKGDIKVRLFDATPLHKANFLMLARRNFYENTVFYRVEENFIVQGGDSDAYERKSIKRKIFNCKSWK